MGHRKKSMNASCDIMWKQTILHAVTGNVLLPIMQMTFFFVVLFFFNNGRFFLHPTQKSALPVKYGAVEWAFIFTFISKSSHEALTSR